MPQVFNLSFHCFCKSKQNGSLQCLMFCLMVAWFPILAFSAHQTSRMHSSNPRSVVFWCNPQLDHNRSANCWVIFSSHANLVIWPNESNWMWKVLFGLFSLDHLSCRCVWWSALQIFYCFDLVIIELFYVCHVNALTILSMMNVSRTSCFEYSWQARLHCPVRPCLMLENLKCTPVENPHECVMMSQSMWVWNHTAGHSYF